MNPDAADVPLNLDLRCSSSASHNHALHTEGRTESWYGMSAQHDRATADAFHEDLGFVEVDDLWQFSSDELVDSGTMCNTLGPL